jgi:hypothetical protein
MHVRGKQLAAAMPSPWPREASFESLTMEFAWALQSLGPRGCRLARREGMREGSRRASGRAGTVAEALRSLLEIGVVCEWDGRLINVRPALDPASWLMGSDVMSALQAGLIQGALDANQLDYTVRRTRTPGRCTLTARPRARSVDGVVSRRAR